eukprot:GDKH01001772.1.p1 GENE.GDKH01001772.1~~GDKH01001772.1.p1  ORF type:complete len:597 (-),score=48.48 GDKH01001772.1:110-1900(-)
MTHQETFIDQCRKLCFVVNRCRSSGDHSILLGVEALPDTSQSAVQYDPTGFWLVRNPDLSLCGRYAVRARGVLYDIIPTTDWALDGALQALKRFCTVYDNHLRDDHKELVLSIAKSLRYGLSLGNTLDKRSWAWIATWTAADGTVHEEIFDVRLLTFLGAKLCADLWYEAMSAGNTEKAAYFTLTNSEYWKNYGQLSLSPEPWVKPWSPLAPVCGLLGLHEYGIDAGDVTWSEDSASFEVRYQGQRVASFSAMYYKWQTADELCVGDLTILEQAIRTRVLIELIRSDEHDASGSATFMSVQRRTQLNEFIRLLDAPVPEENLMVWWDRTVIADDYVSAKRLVCAGEGDSIVVERQQQRRRLFGSGQNYDRTADEPIRVRMQARGSRLLYWYAEHFMTTEEFHREVEGQALHMCYQDGARRGRPGMLKAVWWRFCHVVLPGSTTRDKWGRSATTTPRAEMYIVKMLLRFSWPVQAQEASSAGFPFEYHTLMGINDLYSLRPTTLQDECDIILRKLMSTWFAVTPEDEEASDSSEANEPRCAEVQGPAVATFMHFRHIDRDTACMACGEHHTSEEPGGQFHAFRLSDGWIEEVVDARN